MSINLTKYHLVEMSPWPLTSSLLALCLFFSFIFIFHLRVFDLFSFIVLLILSLFWWRDVSRESFLQGLHSDFVILSLKVGMILFITSEVLFFISFFWTFFHSGVSPIIEIGQLWPPIGLETFNPLNVPLLNSVILLSSGVTVTLSHHQILRGRSFSTYLLLTVLLGFYFTFLQGLEYLESPYTIMDSVFGGVFFLATGFHGLHVILGSMFLLLILIRSMIIRFREVHLVGFELSAWYWHFVDVVWLFLYSSIYWWGSFIH